MKHLLFAASLIALTACGNSNSNEPNYEFDIITNDRSKIGTIALTETDAGVVATINATGISPGEHGMHFHVKADCSSADFKSAGGHINIGGHEHGLNNPHGPDNADMPNAVANADGVVSMTVTNPRVTLGPTRGDIATLFDEDGSSLMIHVHPDDGITQPIGGAGPRIGCAEIKK